MSVPYSSEYCWATVRHGSLPALRTGHEPGAELVRHRRGHDEPAGLDAHDVADRRAGEGLGQAFDGQRERPSASANSGVMSLKTTPGCG